MNSKRILEALRNRKCFAFEELNKAIREKLEEFNAKPFQKKKGSRLTAFIGEEKDFLMPLLLPHMKRLSGQLPPYNPIIS